MAAAGSGGGHGGAGHCRHHAFPSDGSAPRAAGKQVTMAKISKINVRVRTANVPEAATDGRVYAALAGREFRLETPGVDDFEQAAHATYTLGDGSNVTNTDQNDPRSPQLDTSDVTAHPVYIRFEEAGSQPAWAVEGATIEINPGTPSALKYDVTWLTGTGEGHYVWLGADSGKQLNLRRK
ncbi:hypothetical protein [Streptomyces venezuelae]|uniref:hypothetical protein n=1 Tax=Streptomyces venezuelae TaxID=54571 RepID=UPI0037B48EF9